MWGHADVPTTHTTAARLQTRIYRFYLQIIRVLYGRYFEGVALYPWVTLSLTHG